MPGSGPAHKAIKEALMLTGFLLLATVAGALQQSPVIHYRITLKASRNLDRSSSGEDARGGSYSAVAFVTASVTSEPRGRVGHVVIDSVSCSGVGMMSMAWDSIVGKQSKGTRYDFPIGSRLEVLPVPTISNTLTNTLAQVALMLFPTIDPAATVGASWTDSLDTTMGDQADKNHPIITRWKVATVVADTTVAEGDVRGAMSSSGRIVGTGLITGSRHLTAVGGTLRMQTSTVSQETLMAGEGANGITRGTGTTTLEIVAITGQRVTP
jgi:hypothetical protein